MQENEKLNVDELDIEIGQDIEQIGQEIGEMTDDKQRDKQREVYIDQLKKMRMRFNPIKHLGNKTINSFGADYKQKRKKKNKQARASRKANRKK